MRTVSKEELKDILTKHAKWLNNESGGERAYLRDADLRGAYLLGADLQGADLRDADLENADLQGADLRCANLENADLRYANLRGADLQGADLQGANLRGANLRGANFRQANLQNANLQNADLQGADLRDAYLENADLRYANLENANLCEIKKDFFERLLIAKNEIVGLYDYLMRGKIEGNAYSGEYACFVGTISNIRKENWESLSIGLTTNSSSPTERWFLAIKKGDTPFSNQIAAITKEWIEEFVNENSLGILPQYKMISSVEFPGAFNDEEKLK